MAYWERLKCVTSGRPEAVSPFQSPHLTETQSGQAGAISEAPSTWVTLFYPPWRSPETLPTQLKGPPKLLFHINGLSWLMLFNTRGKHKACGPNLALHPQSWQTGSISKILSSSLTLFDLPWRSPEILPHPSCFSI